MATHTDVARRNPQAFHGAMRHWTPLVRPLLMEMGTRHWGQTTVPWRAWRIVSGDDCWELNKDYCWVENRRVTAYWTLQLAADHTGTPHHFIGCGAHGPRSTPGLSEPDLRALLHELDADGPVLMEEDPFPSDLDGFSPEW